MSSNRGVSPPFAHSTTALARWSCSRFCASKYDTPRAFAGDVEALSTAIETVDAGLDRTLDRYERSFLYLPFEHAEDIAMQERSLALFGELARETGERAPLEWAEKHAVIVRRFGRYPHRNAMLGRASTPEELAFLAQPGSSF